MSASIAYDQNLISYNHLQVAKLIVKHCVDTESCLC